MSCHDLEMPMQYQILLARAVVDQAIKDIKSQDDSTVNTANRYIESNRFEAHCKIAGYPDELGDTLKNLVVLSRAERQHSAGEILKLLKTFAAKKTPLGGEGRI